MLLSAMCSSIPWQEGDINWKIHALFHIKFSIHDVFHPRTVLAIGGGAFFECQKLTSAIILE